MTCVSALCQDPPVSLWKLLRADVLASHTCAWGVKRMITTVQTDEHLRSCVILGACCIGMQGQAVNLPFAFASHCK